MNRCGVLYVRHIRRLAISWPDTVFASRAPYVVGMNLNKHFNTAIEAMNMRRRMVVGIKGEPNPIECNLSPK